MILQWSLQFCRFQSLSIVFLPFSVFNSKLKKKSEILKIKFSNFENFIAARDVIYMVVVAMETN